MINQNDTQFNLLENSEMIDVLNNFATLLQDEEGEDLLNMLKSLNFNELTDLVSFYTQMNQVFNYNIFEGGRVVLHSECEQFALVEDNGRVALTTAENLREFENKNLEIAREKQKFKKADFSSVSGFLPQSKEVFCLAAYGLGKLINPSLIFPEYEDGQLFVLGIRKSNIDVLVQDTTYKNVGMPTTLFLVKTKSLSKAKDYGGVSYENIVNGVQVERVFVCCCKDEFTITEETQLYHYPLSNVNRLSHGNVCLGSYTNSDYLFFENQQELCRFVYEFYCNLRDSHEYQVKFKSAKDMSLDKFLTGLKNKDFPDSELISNGETVGSWVKNVITHMYY